MFEWGGRLLEEAEDVSLNAEAWGGCIVLEKERVRVVLSLSFSFFLPSFGSGTVHLFLFLP